MEEEENIDELLKEAHISKLLPVLFDDENADIVSDGSLNNNFYNLWR